MNKQAIIYAFNCMTNILINFDHGIIPACTQEIKLSLNIHDVELGLLGSAVYAGLVLGSLVGSTIFSKIRTKKIVYLSVLCCMLSLGIFIVTKNIYLLFVSRFLVGFFQVCKFKILIFLVVFFPVWTDFYGGIYKTLGLTFMQLGVALGAVVGYLVTSLYVKYTGNWVYPYYLQIALLIPCLLFYTCICSDSDLDTQGNSEEQSILESSPSLRQQVKLLFNNPIFLCTMLALSSLFFVVTGIQFWISDYMRIILNLSQDFVFKAFLVISLTAPILGVFFGGLLLHFMGGYDGQNALKVVALEALLASCAGIPISYLNNVDAVLVLLWLLLFFGGSAVPAITGIMINSIPKDSKSTGNSISHLFQELLGYLPAPMIYGMVQRLTGGPESRYGMMVLTGWSLIGLFFILLCLKLNSQIQSTVNFDTELQILDSSEIKRNVDFSYIKRQTSLSEAKSSYKRSQSHDINQSPLYKKMHSQQLRKLSRKQTFSEAIQNIAHIIGRGSMEPMLIQEHRLLIPEGRVYLISKGEYVDYEQQQKQQQ